MRRLRLARALAAAAVPVLLVGTATSLRSTSVSAHRASTSVAAAATASDLDGETGDPVDAGQLIGAIGNTGSSSGSHLHFEVLTLTGRLHPLAWLAQP